MSQCPSEILPTTEPAAHSARSLKWWMLLLIAFLACAVYANSVKNGFAYDDLGIVEGNPNVVNLEWTRIWHDNYWATKDGIMPDVLYRPLTLWSYLANEALTPGQPWAYHLVNVLLHGLVTVLVAQLAWKLLGDRRIAITAGVLFAVHPLHTEVVANTVGRAELLAALWSLLALMIYLPTTPLNRETAPARRGWWHGWLVAICFFAAILSKETPATLLIAIPFIDLWRWSQRSQKTFKSFVSWTASQSLRYYLPLAILFSVYVAMRVKGPGLMTDSALVHPVVNLLVKATPAERIFTPFLLLGKYLALTFWPVNLSADYSAPSLLPSGDPRNPGVLLGILTIVLAGIFCVKSWKRAPGFVLLVGLFFISYFLIANVVRIGTIFGERLFYWPSTFVLILIAWGGVRIFESVLNMVGTTAESRPGRLTAWCTVVPVAVAAIIAMSYRTIVRNTDWADNITLAIATGRDQPGSAKACHWAGAVLILSKQPEHVALGLELLERSVALYPDMAKGYWDIAKYHGRQKDLGTSLIYLAHAVRLDPGTHDTHLATKGILEDLKNSPPASYMPVLEAYLKEHPDEPEIHFSLAMAYHAQSKWTEAESEGAKAVVFAQNYASHGTHRFDEAWAALARINLAQGKWAEGMSFYFNQYLPKNQRSVDARCEYASILIAADAAKFPDARDKAVQHLLAAEKIEPGNPQIRGVRGELERVKRGLPAVATPLLPEIMQGPLIEPAGGGR